MPVLHLSDPNKEMDRFYLTNAFLGRGKSMEIHITNFDGSTDVYEYTDRSGKTEVRVWVASKTNGCGCP